MKVLFSGPSLTDAERAAFPDFDHRGPAARGDLTDAVEAGAVAIGLVDGLFGNTPAVWHKEILNALATGVRVAGGASMGALRAAECAAFGMVGVGTVYARLAAAAALDDAYVAQIHAPAALGWTPLSEAEANVEATLGVLRRRGVLDRDTAAALAAAASRLHYADRTLADLPVAAGFTGERAAALARQLRAGRVDRKGRDAMKVARWLARQPDARGPAPDGWTFHVTSQWLAFQAERRP